MRIAQASTSPRRPLAKRQITTVTGLPRPVGRHVTAALRAAGLSVSTADDARDRAGALVGESVIRSESSVDAGVEASVEVGADLVMEVLLEQARR